MPAPCPRRRVGCPPTQAGPGRLVGRLGGNREVDFAASAAAVKRPLTEPVRQSRRSILERHRAGPQIDALRAPPPPKMGIRKKGGRGWRIQRLSPLLGRLSHGSGGPPGPQPRPSDADVDLCMCTTLCTTCSGCGTSGALQPGAGGPPADGAASPQRACGARYPHPLRLCGPLVRARVSARPRVCGLRRGDSRDLAHGVHPLVLCVSLSQCS